MYRLDKCTNKGAKCGSCNSTEDLYDLVLCETESCKVSVCICKDCMLNLAKQCNEEVPTHDNDDIEDGIYIPQGTFVVEGFTCKVASYNDKEFILELLDVKIPPNLTPRVLSIFIQKYGYETRLRYSEFQDNTCIISIPTKNIIERGGLL